MFSLEIVLKAHDLSSPRMCMILPMESLGFSSLAAYIWQTMLEVLLSCICPLWLGERKVSTCICGLSSIVPLIISELAIVDQGFTWL